MRYDLTDLRLFINIGETLNLTRAAERVFLSLPAASTRIKNLEDALKVRLLVRQVTGVKLTSAGEVLYKHAQQVFKQLETLHTELQPFSLGLKGQLRILANTPATNAFMTEALADFLIHYPDVNIIFEEKSTKDVITLIRSGVGDIGFVSAEPTDLSGLEVISLFSDELVVVVNEGHLLNQQKEIYFADLLDQYQFIGLGEDSALQSFLENHAHQLGKRVCQRVSVDSFETAARMVLKNIGIAIMPLEYVSQLKHMSSLRFLKMRDVWARRDRYICRLPNQMLPNYSEMFISIMKKTIQSKQ